MAEWISTPQSSNIAGYSYNLDNGVLTVEFKNGTRYDYFDVPENVYSEFSNAASVGKYFNTNIRDKYRYSRV